MATQPQNRQPDPFLARIAEFDDAVVREFYDRIGQIDYLYLAPLKDGDKPRTINYGKRGPGLAVMKEKIDAPGRRPLLLLTPWQGLPDLQEASNQQCTACQSKCLDCDGEGKKKCTLMGCYGTGYQWSGEVKRDCPSCKATGMEMCGACSGSGRRATGYQGGADYKPGMQVLPPECPQCKGNRLVMRPKEQPWEQFRLGTRAPYMALGPIIRITYHTDGRQGAFESLNIMPDSEGNVMVLMFDQSNKQFMRQYLFGGVPVSG
jgi:hypothetical protein